MGIPSEYSAKAGTGFILFLSLFFALFVSMVAAAPEGPSNVAVHANETASATAAVALNTSGGYITTINITASTQNTRWKAFVGNVTGTFTLDDSSGSTIYDWTLTSISGEVYATRNDTTVMWTNIQCANFTILNNENTAMSHTSVDDNLTATFSGSTHQEFFVGSTNISENSCPTLNTYISSASQDTSFEEVTLTDSIQAGSSNVVYATILESDLAGFDGQEYDFQMIVPDEGGEGFTGSTAYYLYVELS